MTDTHEVRELRYRIKQLGKQNGRQGETIHRLRADLAETRELNSKIERGHIRSLERTVENLLNTVVKNEDVIAELREKLSAATEVQ